MTKEIRSIGVVKAPGYSFYRPHRRVMYTGELVNHKTGEVYTPPARTKQQFLEQCDINTIVKQFTKTGQFSHLSANLAKGTYADLPDPIEFQDSMNTVIQAEQAFASLPAKVRNRFGNDPAEFLDFIGRPENQDEAIKMGLATDNRDPGVRDPGVRDPGVSTDSGPNVGPTKTSGPGGTTGGDGGKPPSEGPKGP